MMDTAAFIQELIGDGLNISLSEDGERIKIDTTQARLSDERREQIKENKTEIIAYLQRKTFNPKVARGAIHYILHRSQRQMDTANLTTEEKASCIVQVEKNLNDVWKAYEDTNPWSLRAALRTLYRSVLDYVSNVRNDRDSDQAQFIV